VYSINWIPLGGFVKIVGENNESEQDPRSFVNKPFWPRLATLIAGVVMNVLLAWFLISVGFMRGLPVATDSSAELKHGATIKNAQVAIMEVGPGLPAEKAGLKTNDIIVKIDGKNVGTIEEVQHTVKERQGNRIDFTVKRGSEELTLGVDSLANPPEGSGPTGVSLASIGLLKYPWHWAIVEGLTTTFSQLWAIVSGIYLVFSSGQGLDSLGGPAKIAQLTGQVADLGLAYLIQFTAFLSLNLAILNILPFPALDGGRVLFLVIEKVRGKRNNQKIEQIANTAGFLLLLMLMVFVTVNDIRGFGGIGNVVKKLFGG
jgi:regulator of sigma E protease